MAYLNLYISGWKEHGGAPGIGVIRFNSDNGHMEYLGKQHEDLSCNCAVIDTEKNILYITNELHENPDFVKGGGGLIYAFSVNPESGELTQLSRVYATAPCPCFLSLDKTKKYLLLANHSGYNCVTKAVKGEDGYYHMVRVFDDCSVCLFRLNEDGSIGPMVDVHNHEDYPVEGRALHSRPHTILPSPDGKFFACCDKGDSHIYFYELDYENEKLVLVGDPYAEKPGSAPRYCAFHPIKPFFFHNHERNMDVASFTYNEKGELTPVNVICSLADDVPQHNTLVTREYLHGEPMRFPNDGFMPLEQQGFVIHPNGKWIYDMLNGADAVSVLNIDQETGALSLAQTVPVDGRWVRGCAISPDGRFLVVTCLQGGGVFCYAIGEDGKLGEPVSHVDFNGGSYATFWPTK